jgi:hypothetical protein
VLARRLTTILPAMTLAEAMDTTRNHRVGGLTDGRPRDKRSKRLITRRPITRGNGFAASWTKADLPRAVLSVKS